MLLTLLSFQGSAPAEAGRSGGGMAWPNLPYQGRRVLPTERKTPKRPKRARVAPARPPAPTKRRKAKPLAPEVVPEVFPIPNQAPAPEASAAIALPLAAAWALDGGMLLGRQAVPRPSIAAGVDELLQNWRQELIDSAALAAGMIEPEPAPLPPHLRWPDDEEVCIAAAMLLL
jgi:hypothetical protein